MPHLSAREKGLLEQVPDKKDSALPSGGRAAGRVSFGFRTRTRWLAGRLDSAHGRFLSLSLPSWVLPRAHRLASPTSRACA